MASRYDLGEGELLDRQQLLDAFNEAPDAESTELAMGHALLRIMALLESIDRKLPEPRYAGLHTTRNNFSSNNDAPF